MTAVPPTILLPFDDGRKGAHFGSLEHARVPQPSGAEGVDDWSDLSGRRLGHNHSGLSGLFCTPEGTPVSDDTLGENGRRCAATTRTAMTPSDTSPVHVHVHSPFKEALAGKEPREMEQQRDTEEEPQNPRLMLSETFQLGAARDRMNTSTYALGKKQALLNPGSTSIATEKSRLMSSTAPRVAPTRARNLNKASKRNNSICTSCSSFTQGRLPKEKMRSSRPNAPGVAIHDDGPAAKEEPAAAAPPRASFHTTNRPPMTDSPAAFPRISRPVELMRSSYDVVVIGSGYGGGVAASRMARAGQSVCLLELGKERWPGEYPVSAADACSELHCSGDLQPSDLSSTMGIAVGEGRPTGMYHLIFGRGQNAMVANGEHSE